MIREYDLPVSRYSKEYVWCVIREYDLPVSRYSKVYVWRVIREYDLEVPKEHFVRPFRVILRNVTVNEWRGQALKIITKTPPPPFVVWLSARRIEKRDHV